MNHLEDTPPGGGAGREPLTVSFSHWSNECSVRLLTSDDRLMRRALVFLLPLVLAAQTLATAAPVATAGDASITHDPRAGTWSIGAGGATLTLALDPGRDFAVLNLVSSANRRWTVGTAPDTFLVLDGRTMPFGSTTAGFTCEDISVSSDASTLRLDATFALSRSSLRITRHYRVTSGSPTFETWNTYTPSDKGVDTLS